MPTLLLFDIDGTLIMTGGAGFRAIQKAVDLTMGVERGLDGIPVAGRTDSIILRDAVRALDGSDITIDLRDRIRAGDHCFGVGRGPQCAFDQVRHVSLRSICVLLSGMYKRRWPR